jgi:hypothetical protein
MAQVRRVTIDEKFNAEYAKKGLQPSVSTDGRIRNVRMEKRSANDDVYNQEAVNDPVYQQSTPVREQIPATTSQQRTVSPQNATKTKATKINPANAGKRKKARLKAMVINRSAFPPIVFLYFSLQLPLALLHVVFFGLTAIVLNVREATTNADGVAGFMFDIFGFVAGALNTIVEVLTGFDLLGFLELVNPTNVYLIITSLLLGYSIILLLTISLIYQFAGIKSLSGKASGAKIMAFIGCLFGYFWPLFSFFPWVLVWMFVVGRNPN